MGGKRKKYGIIWRKSLALLICIAMITMITPFSAFSEDESIGESMEAAVDAGYGFDDSAVAGEENQESGESAGESSETAEETEPAEESFDTDPVEEEDLSYEALDTEMETESIEEENKEETEVSDELWDEEEPTDDEDENETEKEKSVNETTEFDKEETELKEKNEETEEISSDDVEEEEALSEEQSEEKKETEDTIAEEEKDKSEENKGIQTLSTPVVYNSFASDKVVFNLGNGNGLYNFADYAGNKSAGTDLRYSTDSLSGYADENGDFTIRLPSDEDLGGDHAEKFIVATGDTFEISIEFGREMAYDYKLVGWVNIATGKYYDVSDGSVTATINLGNNNVFYADWIADDYDHGSPGDNDLKETVSTRNFVTFHLFDFNELFNLYSASLEQKETGSGEWIEAWTDSGSLYAKPLLGNNGDELEKLTKSFLFVNDGTTEQSQTGGMLSWPDGKKIWNTWTGDTKKAVEGNKGFVLDSSTEWDIEKPEDSILGMLFEPESDSLGVHYVGEGNYLFWLENGYYTYDSERSAAVYNQTDERFYVYNDKQKLEKGATTYTCFFPFNDYTYENALSPYDGNVNYWFGMSMEVTFYLPNGTANSGGGNTVSGQDMVFNFSGDDDILIFVDDDLILDMSGMHDEAFGSINFNTGEAKIGMSKDDEGTFGIIQSDEYIDISSGAHKLTVYYMERGGYASNLAVSFNVVPMWDYARGEVQTVIAEKIWRTGTGEDISDETLNEMFETPSIEVGLFDVLYEKTGDDMVGYTRSGSNYTVEFTDDHEIAHKYVYTVDKNGDSLTYTQNGGDPIVDNQTDEEGRVLDNDGYVVAWFDSSSGKLHIRFDQQTLNSDNGWSYDWELLDSEGEYEILELSSVDGFTTVLTTRALESHKYWSIIGEKELMDDFTHDTKELEVILTDAAQQTDEHIGDTKEANGWVIVASNDQSVGTEKAAFSQIADLITETNEEGIIVSHGIYGVTGHEQIDPLGEGAIWHAEDAGISHGDVDGSMIEEFWLYCYLNDDETKSKYYLTTNDDLSGVTISASEPTHHVFYYDAIGELMMSVEGVANESDQASTTYRRVYISEDGDIHLGFGETDVAKNDVRIYTYTDTVSTGIDAVIVNQIEIMDISGEKIWNDNENQDGIRPVSIVIHLYADGEEVKSEGVTAVDNWKWHFSGLPKYKLSNGEKIDIDYEVWEEETEGYESEITGNSELGFVITNTHIPETIEISGEKIWDDSNDQDGERPENIIIHLYADGMEIAEQIVTAADNWSWSFTDLDKYKNGGVEIHYTITEDVVTDYTTEIYDPNVTNRHNPGKTSLNVQKIWIDDEDQDGERPVSVVVALTRNGAETGDFIILNEENNWHGIFADLDEYTDGRKNDYSISEVGIEDYVSDIVTVGGTSSIYLYNQHKSATIDISGEKIWDDGNNQDGKRPESILIRLYADGVEIDELVVTAADNWRWNFTDLDKYKDHGVEINYSITEDAVEDYSSYYDGYDIINHYAPGKTSISVVKLWNDVHDQDHLRAQSITIELLKNGQETGETLVLNAENHWTGSFEDLDEYEEATQVRYDYTVREYNVEGYSNVYSGDMEHGFVIINTHIPENSPGTGGGDTHNSEPSPEKNEFTLALTKEVQGSSDMSTFDFEITLTDQNGTFYNGTVTAGRTTAEEETNDEILTFTNGQTVVTVNAGETIWFTSDTQFDYTVTELTEGAYRTYVYVDGVLQQQETDEPAEAAGILTADALTQVEFINSYRGYFPIDEEIVPDHEDRDSWVKNESVNEYNAIEIVMFTYLPIVASNDLMNGSFTMNFHDILDSELNLDDTESNFTVMIGETEIGHEYYTVKILPETDDCSFHVEVDLTALYLDGVIVNEDLLGDTEIKIFFFADLEGTGLNSSYTSTVWYEIFDEDELLYTSNIDVVYVYTYEIEIFKYDEEMEDPIEGASFGIYYDRECEEPVYRYEAPYFSNSQKSEYTVSSEKDGYAIFYGLADGTYYVKELAAPEDYILNEEPVEVVLGQETTIGYVCGVNFANTTNADEPAQTPSTSPGSSRSTSSTSSASSTSSTSSSGGGGGTLHNLDDWSPTTSSTTGISGSSISGGRYTSNESNSSGSSDGSGGSGSGNDKSNGSGDGSDDSEGLPQTGQLLWPIPVLIACGVLLIVFGWVMRRTQKKNKI